MAMSVNFDPCILLKFLIGYIICLGYKYIKLTQRDCYIVSTQT